MNRYLSFLYYYTFCATVLIFVWAFVYAPKPEGLLLVLIFTPVAAYFIVKVARRRKTADFPEDITEKKQPYFPPLLFLIILTTLFIAAFSAYAYLAVGNLSAKNESSPYQQIANDVRQLKEDFKKFEGDKNSDNLSNSEVSEIRDLILNVKKTKDEEVLGSYEASPSGQLGFVQMKNPNSGTVSFYKEKSYSSGVVGKLEPGKQYLYYKVENPWYFITTSDGKEGWANAQLLTIMDESAQ